jgi:heme-degrading monooxygenase HmoA
MYAGCVTFHVRRGKLGQAVRMWKEDLLPLAEQLAGYQGSALLVNADQSQMLGIGFWDTRAHADAWSETGPWQWGSHARMKFETLLADEATRQEMQVAYLNVIAYDAPNP